MTATAARPFVFHRPPLYPAQRAAIYCDARYGVIEASSKSGKTVGCLVWLVEQALQGRRGWAYWWLAPTYSMAKTLAFSRLLRMAQPPGSLLHHDSELWVELPNGARLWFKGSDRPDTLYGEDVHAAVVDEASRCFIAGTPIAIPGGTQAIETLRTGDPVLNGAGIGYVRRVMRKSALAVAVVSVADQRVVSSINHRYFTQRGWVEAHDLRSTDTLLTRDAALHLVWQGLLAAPREAESEVLLSTMPLRCDPSSNRDTRVRMVSHGLHRLCVSPADAAFLRTELLCEMEDAATRPACEVVSSSGAGQDGSGTAALLGGGYPTSAGHETRPRGPECDARSARAGESVGRIAGGGASTAVVGWEGTWNERASAPTRHGVGERLAGRVSRWSESPSGRLADLLVSRSGPSAGEVGGRSGWSNASAATSPSGRCTEGSVLAGARVDGVEILQSGDHGFSAYSGGRDTVNLYDLAVSGHPSFTVNDFLVHNCKPEAWHAVRSTLTHTQGPVRCIGNVKGRRNWFYNLARQAESGDKDMHYARITAYDAVAAGVLSADEIADAKARLSEAIFNELFLAIPSDDQGNPFGLVQIRACVRPLSTNPPVVWGWDLARGIKLDPETKGRELDWTVGIGLDRQGHVCGFQRWQRPWDQTFTDLLRTTGGVAAWVDSTGAGDPLLAFLQQGRSNFHRYDFTGPSKQHLMDGLARAIHSQSVGFPAGMIVTELETFEYEYRRTGVRFSAPEGLHDDCVCALALAVHGLTTTDVQSSALRPAGITRVSPWRKA